MLSAWGVAARATDTDARTVAICDECVRDTDARTDRFDCDTRSSYERTPALIDTAPGDSKSPPPPPPAASTLGTRVSTSFLDGDAGGGDARGLGLAAAADSVLA
jgi:hypothetical protein